MLARASSSCLVSRIFFFFQAEDGIRDYKVTGVQTCALPISGPIDHGIKFRRKDLPDEPTIDATIHNLKTVERATTIGEGSVRVHTVEHVLEIGRASCRERV